MDQEASTDGRNTDPDTELQGYRAPQACQLIGITYRQLDYWARTDLLKPSLRAAAGSGSQRLYSFSDLVQLRVIKRLLDGGVHLNKIRKAVEWLRDDLQIDHPLAEMDLLFDGSTILTRIDREDTEERVVDALRRGQMVLALPVGQIRRDLEGEILAFAPNAEQAELPFGEHESRPEAANS